MENQLPNADMFMFAQWCLETERYKYDTIGKFWFNTRTFKKLGWDELWIKYVEANS
jgi:hypothetical protein